MFQKILPRHHFLHDQFVVLYLYMHFFSGYEGECSIPSDLCWHVDEELIVGFSAGSCWPVDESSFSFPHAETSCDPFLVIPFSYTSLFPSHNLWFHFGSTNLKYLASLQYILPISSGKDESLNREGAKFLIKRGRFVVISAELVPEAQEVEDSRLEGEIREGVEIPWLKEVLKVRIRHHFKVRSPE